MARSLSSLTTTLALVLVFSACSYTDNTSSEKKTADPVVNRSPLQPSTSLTSPSDAGFTDVNRSAGFTKPLEFQEAPALRPPIPLQKDLRPLLDALPKGAEVGYLIVDLDRGIPLVEHNADRDHIPASAAKLVTAVAALDILGPEYRYRTELLANGAIDEGILEGDLILKGGGDPLLDIPDLLMLVAELADRGVRKITGRLVIDDTLLPTTTEIEPSQPLEAPYNPGLGALSIAFNRVHLSWQNEAELFVETVPHLEEAKFEQAELEALPPGGVQLKHLEDGEAVWQLADRGARRSEKSLPVKDAGLYAGRIFADLAALHGIDLPSPQRAVPMPAGRLLAVHESRPLRELVRNMLWYSNNMMAELIGLSAARAIEPDLSNLQASAGILLAQLKQQIPDASWADAKLGNHSGLSSAARLTPEQLAAILSHGWKNRMLPSLLPVSGWSGTLARRFNGPDQVFRIWAKTGAINYVATLAGYLLSSPYSPAVFVVMISDKAARAGYDALPRRTRAAEKNANLWHRDAQKTLDRIVEQWLEPALAS